MFRVTARHVERFALFGPHKTNPKPTSYPPLNYQQIPQKHDRRTDEQTNTIITYNSKIFVERSLRDRRSHALFHALIRPFIRFTQRKYCINT